jgi:anti-anti-sigma factor
MPDTNPVKPTAADQFSASSEVVACAKLEGRLDFSSEGIAETTLLGLINDETKWLVLDCSKLTFLASAGLRVLLSISKRMTPNKGSIILMALQSEVVQILNLSGMADLFISCNNDAEALAHIVK